MSQPQRPIVLRHCAQVVAVCNNKELFKAGDEMNKVVVYTDAAVAVNSDGIITGIYSDPSSSSSSSSTPMKELPDLPDRVIRDSDNIECVGCAVLPGLVDCHTHPVWAGDRSHEFALKIGGASYMEIHKAGGGIGFTVNHTMNTSLAELQKLLQSRLDRMLAQGTTLAEAKSGYGLETETEMKMLKAIHNVSKTHPVELVSTFLGAHSVPKGKTADEQTKIIIDEMIPELVKLKAKGEINPEFVDVFHEAGIFETENTEKILLAGKKVGMDINFHGDELHYVGSGELGGKIGARAISHLELLSDEGIKAMLIRPTFAVLLPSTAHIMHLVPPPAKKIIAAGVPVALASDFNPNAHCLSMPYTMNLACIIMGMTLNQSLVAATINAAASLNRSHTHGSIEVGKVGDFVVIGSPKWEHIIYEMADPPIEKVIKRGKIVFEKK
eukprot:TRINITY_DN541_c0_g1_i1.p1 TRINITY_DN541_c0_g1~~TRINITY_DN541_c0_g1_i1.p1  ORF type:complete len:455 (+),score=155.96 TRINITY_DN541_c0_g1_i1:47-1366(+)